MKPVVDRLREEFEGRVEFRIMNFDNEPTVANAEADRFGVQFVPTFVFLNSDGTIETQRVGVVPEKEMRSILESLE